MSKAEYTIGGAADRIIELEKLVDHYAAAQVWYVEMLEAMAPFRYHHAQLRDKFYRSYRHSGDGETCIKQPYPKRHTKR